MYAEPMILPLDANGRIYALQDEKGNTIGTGTREVCEVLLYIITKPASPSSAGLANVSLRQRSNVRAAIKYLAFGSGSGSFQATEVAVVMTHRFRVRKLTMSVTRAKPLANKASSPTEFFRLLARPSIRWR